MLLLNNELVSYILFSFLQLQYYKDMYNFYINLLVF